jgi:hypothetical protein
MRLRVLSPFFVVSQTTTMGGILSRVERTCYRCRPVDHDECDLRELLGCPICQEFLYRYCAYTTLPSTWERLSVEEKQRRWTKHYGSKGWRSPCGLRCDDAGEHCTQFFCQHCNNGKGGPKGSDYKDDGYEAHYFKEDPKHKTRGRGRPWAEQRASRDSRATIAGPSGTKSAKPTR